MTICMYMQVLNDPIALSTWPVESGKQSFQILSLKRYMYNKYHQANIEQLRSNAPKRTSLGNSVSYVYYDNPYT